MLRLTARQTVEPNKEATGVAPNGIELHPVLGFACLSS